MSIQETDKFIPADQTTLKEIGTMITDLTEGGSHDYKDTLLRDRVRSTFFDGTDGVGYIHVTSRRETDSDGRIGWVSLMNSATGQTRISVKSEYLLEISVEGRLVMKREEEPFGKHGNKVLRIISEGEAQQVKARLAKHNRPSTGPRR